MSTDTTAPVNFEIRQRSAGTVDAYIWRGEREHMHTPGYVIKYRTVPALINIQPITSGSPADAERLIGILEKCIEIARALDSEFAEGVPDVTRYQERNQ